MRSMPGTMMRTLLACAALVIAAFSASVWAQSNSIEAINVASQPAGSVIVRVSLKDAPLTPPAGFTVNNPPRIAFDFPNTSNALGRSTQEVGGGGVLRRINVVQSGGRTRMVLELSRALTYDARVERP